MNMVEKVAKSICMAQWGGYPLDEKARNEWPEWRQAVKLARAAIEAMWEPTEDMMEEVRSHCFPGDTPTYQEAWEYMIDAALKEEA